MGVHDMTHQQPMYQPYELVPECSETARAESCLLLSESSFDAAAGQPVPCHKSPQSNCLNVIPASCCWVLPQHKLPCAGCDVKVAVCSSFADVTGRCCSSCCCGMQNIGWSDESVTAKGIILYQISEILHRFFV